MNDHQTSPKAALRVLHQGAFILLVIMSACSFFIGTRMVLRLTASLEMRVDLEVPSSSTTFKPSHTTIPSNWTRTTEKEAYSDIAPTMHVRVLFFETSAIAPEEVLPIQQARRAGISAAMVGYDELKGASLVGFGKKWSVIRDALSHEVNEVGPGNNDDDTLMIVADTRDVLFNIHHDSSASSIAKLLQRVIDAFFSITEGFPQAVLFGTELQCCVAATTQVRPGAFFDESYPNNRRKKRACKSNSKGCEWQGVEGCNPWIEFAFELAEKRTRSRRRSQQQDLLQEEVAEPFLNGGLVMGTRQNLLRMIDFVDFEDTEDDQAVFFDLMYRRPDLILLDYFQEIFGSARFGLGMKNQTGCNFERRRNNSTSRPAAGNLHHVETNNEPLLLHGLNRYFQCLDRMANDLGEQRSNAFKELGGPAHESERPLIQPLMDRMLERKRRRREVVSP